MDGSHESEGDHLTCLECGAPVVIEARGFVWQTAPGRLMVVKGDAPVGVAAPPAAWIRCMNGHTYILASGPLATRISRKTGTIV